MLEQFVKNGWFLLLVLFSLGSITILDDLKRILGNDLTIWILILLSFLLFVLSFTHFAKQLAKYLLGIYILIILVLFFVLRYYTTPEQLLSNAEARYDLFENASDYYLNSLKPGDKVSEATLEYFKIEKKASQYELEAARLRYYGPKSYYGFETWQYIFFGFTIVVFIVYSICWFVYQYRI